MLFRSLWVTGAQWCDFVAYDDRLPDGLQFFLKRVRAADLDIPGYDEIARSFLSEVDSQIGKIRNLMEARK